MQVNTTETYEVSGNLAFSLGALSVDTENGRGHATFQISDTSAIIGTAEMQRQADGLLIVIRDFHLVIESRANSLGGSSARFDVIVDQFRSFDVPSVDFLESGEVATLLPGPGVLPGIDVIVMGVHVTPPADTSGLGDNRATFSIPTPLLGAILEGSGGMDSLSRLSVVKLEEDGKIFIQPMSCEISSGYYECVALFSGDAGGFSTFVIVLTQDQVKGQEIPTNNMAVTPTATALPNPNTGSIAEPTPLFPIDEPLTFGGDNSGDLGLWIVYGVLGFFTLSGIIGAVRIFRPRS